MKRLIAALWVVLLLGGNGALPVACIRPATERGTTSHRKSSPQPITARNALTLTPVPMGRDDVDSRLTANQ